jgi:CDP-6-deoxy-D-xylo-4-hexulose-3-dehydrase
MVLTDNEILGRTAYKYANWGRDCWCRPGQDGLCGNRFEYEISGVPYDHKYIFSVPGYNVTPLDYCGVIGKIQLSKADGFKAIRKRNFKYINDRLEDLDDLIVRPKSVKDADVNWFGYPITLKKGARTDITRRIEANGVGTRNMFGGNITRQPMFRGYEINAPCGLEESDRVMTNTFIVGLGQSITEEEMEKITRVVRAEVIVG